MIGVVDRHATLPVARPPGLVRAARRRLRRARAGRRRSRRCASARSSGPSASRAATCGEADLILGLDRDDRDTLLLWHATRIALAPQRVAGVVGAGLERALAPVRPTTARRGSLERVFVWVARARRSSRSSPTCRAPSTCTSRPPRSTSGSGARGARGRLEPLRFDDPDVRRGGPPLRRRHGRGPDLEAGARHLLVHRVRALPGRLPGVRDRQGALAEARDHGPARPGVRAARRCSRTAGSAADRRSPSRGGRSGTA